MSQLQAPQAKVAKQDQQKKDEEHAKVEDHITKRFELLEFKGKGAYGVVWKAIDKKSQQTVALKKVFDAFHNATDSQRTFREVIFLEQLTEHENIVKLLSVIRAENDRDLYMVFEFMETDLHKVIRAGILEPIHKKYIVYQSLKALKYIHSADLVHRDLKPSNLLINSQCKIKVADFGLARSLSATEEESNPVMTEYVATRWYRAPEILLGSQHYSKAVDMWSIGCIVGEMVVGKAIFAGNSTLNQLERIIELIGRPKPDDLQAIQAPLASNVLQNITTQKKKSFGQFFTGASDDAVDFIRNCLAYNPSKRMNVEQGLSHPFLKEFIGTEAETVKDKKILTFLNDNHKFTVKEYRQELYSHLASQKRQAHKQLVIRVHKNIERQPISDSPQKTDQKTEQKQQPQQEMLKEMTEQCENVQTVKRTQEDSEPQKSRKVYHNKSQSYVVGQYGSYPQKKDVVSQVSQVSQQSINNGDLEASQSPMNKRKQSDGRLVPSRTNSIAGETKSFLPVMEPSPNKPLSRNSSNDKKIRTSQVLASTQSQFHQQQQQQQTQSTYFFNGPQPFSRKNSLTKIPSKQPKSLQTSQQATPVNSFTKQGVLKGYMDKSIGEQYKQYMSMKQLMGATNYESIFQQKVKQRK